MDLRFWNIFSKKIKIVETRNMSGTRACVDSDTAERFSLQRDVARVVGGMGFVRI